MQLLLDTGPWLALHCRDERLHAWAREQFAQSTGPLLTCEAVVAEACFLLARAGHDPAKALALLSHGVVKVAMSLGEEVGSVQALFQRFDNAPASLADACLVRMREMFAGSRVFTLDADLRIYRRHVRKVIPVLSPQ